MNTGTRKRVSIISQIQETLVDLTIDCLLERPDDVINYAVDYFKSLKQSKCTEIVRDFDDTEETSCLVEESSLENFNIVSCSYSSHRNAICALPDIIADDYVKIIYPKTDEQRRNLIQTVRNLMFFRNLNTEQLNELLDAMREFTVEPEDIIIRQGDVGDYFYVIQNGIYEVYVKRDDANDSKIELVHTYDGKGYFGELALLHNLQRAATVKAVTGGVLWVLDRQSFKHILFKYNDDEREDRKC